MKSIVAATAAVLLFPLVARAEVTLELSDVHLCCGACVKGVSNAVVSIPGLHAASNASTGKVTLTADSRKELRAGLEALAKAGFHGKSNHPQLKMPDNSGAPSGNVKRLVVHGAHNCCGGCANAIEDAVTGVAGVSACQILPKKESFVVEGDFSATAVVKALNEAGFHVTVSTN